MRSCPLRSPCGAGRLVSAPPWAPARALSSEALLSRAAAQISSGIALGTALTGLAAQAIISEGMDGRDIALLVAAAALMIGVGLLAATRAPGAAHPAHGSPERGVAKGRSE